MRQRVRVPFAFGAMVPALFFVSAVAAQHGHPSGGHAAAPHVAGKAEKETPIRMTMEELHRHGGIPPGWRFRLPEGDPASGREVFAKLECYACHNVQGEKFPERERKPAEKGPDLTGMGAHHPAEYLFESVLHPNRVITQAPGYSGPDGLSIMPSYNHLITLEEALNLVAYVKSLTKGGHRGMPVKYEAKAAPHGEASHGGSSEMAEGEKGALDLRIMHGKLAEGPKVLRVTQGETVRLRWTTDAATKVHVHGYDIEKPVKPNAPAVMTFKAHAAGRFPVTAHGAGGHGHGEEGGEATLLYLEVHPR